MDRQADRHGSQRVPTSVLHNDATIIVIHDAHDALVRALAIETHFRVRSWLTIFAAKRRKKICNYHSIFDSCVTSEDSRPKFQFTDRVRVKFQFTDLASRISIYQPDSCPKFKFRVPSFNLPDLVPKFNLPTGFAS